MPKAYKDKEASRRKLPLGLEWDGKVGPAFLMACLGTVSILFSIGVIWGQTTSRLEKVDTNALEAKHAVVEATKDNRQRDTLIATQSERLGKIETAVQFIVPVIQRIEAKIDSAKNN